MFRSHRHSNLLHQYYARYAAAGFVALGLGYMLRVQLSATHGAITLFLGIFPNLVGSFATPFLLMLLLSRSQKRRNILPDWRVFGLVLLFTFVVSWLIEVLHVVFDLGVFDRNDMVASFVGAGVAFVVFVLTVREGRVNPLAASQ